ncbi:MAG: hypothetical protein RML40_05870 [Bacteroidota bacterium]|nr:hypothetical protein [Candidatus Kapabacteria bacterium]MDW8220040.1 hypothetical protein [Bacteroidota bacterium]
MKRYILSIAVGILLTLALGHHSLHAQDDKLNQFSFEDIPAEETKPAYFAISGGFTATWLFTRLDDINTLTSSALGGAVYSSPLVLLGGEAFAAIGIIPNVRVGIMSIGGTNVLRNSASGMQLERQAEYSISITGACFDYAWTPLKGFSIIPGIRAGGGFINYEISQSLGATQSYPIFPIISASNAMRRMRANMLFVMPNLNLEYAFTLVSMVRVNVGYNLSFVQDWRVDNLATLSNVSPAINATGLTAQVGLFVGLFNN